MLPVAVAVGADLHRPGSSSSLVSPSLDGQSPIQKKKGKDSRLKKKAKNGQDDTNIFADNDLSGD